MKKNQQHSTSKQRNNMQLINSSHHHQLHSQGMPYQRRCHTPSILTQHQKKCKSRQAKDITHSISHTNQKKPANYSSIKHISKPQQTTSFAQHNYSSNLPVQLIKDKPSPFKHKHKKNKSVVGGSFLNSVVVIGREERRKDQSNKMTPGNARHARNLQSQLSHLANLSDSNIFKNQRHSDKQREQGSGKKPREQSSVKKHTRSKKHMSSQIHESIQVKQHPLLTQGKSLMKSHKFQQSIKLFTQLLQQLSLHPQPTPTSPHFPTLLQCHYLTGVCHFHLNQFQSVVPHLTKLICLSSQYRKNVYLFLGIAYKKLQMIEESLLVLSKALDLFPKYVDVLLLRAKILSKQKRFYDAVEDLNKCIRYDMGSLQAYVAKADCLRSLGQFKQAIGIYTEVVGKDKPNLDILLKRAITYIQNQQITQALSDLTLILSHSPTNSQAYLFKGLAYTKSKNYNQSILSYQQSIKFNTSKKATTKALYQIAKLKIQLGDFYGAAYTLERGLSLDVDLKVIQKLKIFVDGATFVMKKKYRKGIELLNILAKKQHLNEMIRSLLYGFRAYAHFCMNKYASALTDLKALGKCGFVIDAASQYNMTLLQGIIKCQNNEFAQAMAKFSKAVQLRPQLGDPCMYQALSKIHQYNRTPKLRSKNTHLLKQSLHFITSALQKQQNFNYHYLCALVLYILKDGQKAMTHLQQAIEASDVHVLKHFYLRAMINASQEKYQQAYTDLNNVLSISKELKEKDQAKKEEGASKEEFTDFQDTLNKDKEILDVYLNRAKCYLIFGEKKKAFQDLQTFIAQKPMDSGIHMIAGKLLFSIGACQDAIKAFGYSPNIDKNRDSLLSRAKCYIYLKQLNLALRDLQKLAQLGDKLVQFDYCCLSALKQASKCQQENFRSALQKISMAQSLQHKQGNIFSLSDLFFYKGVFYFYLQEYDHAKRFMLKSKNLKKLNNEIEPLGEGYSKKELSEEEYEQLFQNRIFTDKEIEYNVGCCEVMLGNGEKEREVFGEGEKDREDGEQIAMTPYPTSNRLCSIFPQIQYDQSRKFRLSFDLPAVHSPPIQFQTQYKLIQQVSISSIQSRPDAPWIKRNKFGVVFTTSEQLLKVDDVDIKTERSQGQGNNEGNIESERMREQATGHQHNYIQEQSSLQLQEDDHFVGNQREEIRREGDEDGQEENYELDQRLMMNEEEESSERHDKGESNRQNLREMFELDAKVEERLKRLMKNTQENK